MFKNKSGKFFNYNFPTAGTVVFFIVISLVITYLINFFMNQFFGTRILPLGQPLRFVIIGIAIISAFFVIGRKQGDLDRNAIFAILLVALGAGALFYYLPQLAPELFKNSIINSVYTNSNSPIYIWVNATSTLHSGIQSVIPIP